MRYRLSTGPWPTRLEGATVTRPFWAVDPDGFRWRVHVLQGARAVIIQWTPDADPQPTRAARDEWIAAHLAHARMAFAA